MKLKFWIIALFIGNSLYAQSTTPNEMTVKEVTLYLQNAKVYGTTPLQLQKGKNIITITNLPNDIDERTYKINLERGTTLLSITPQTNHIKEGVLTSVEKTLTQQKKHFQKTVDLLNIQIKNLLGEQTIINNNLSISKDDKVTPQEQLVKLTTFYRSRMLEIDNQNYVLNEQKNQWIDSIAKIDQQLQMSQTFKYKNKKELVLELLADKITNYDLGISYIVSNAGWAPNYDIRAIASNKPIEIIYKAKIYQKTGQDWKNVKLYVSTFRPTGFQDRPILRPLYVAEYIAYNATQDVSQKAMYKKEMTNSYQMREDENVVMNEPVAIVNDQQRNVLYELKYVQDIMSQEKEQHVILDRKETEATFKYHAVPKVNHQVFLMAFIKDWHQLNLVSGEANVFFEDNFIGKTNLQSNYLKDEYPISLGVDERIIMRRTKIQDKVITKTMNANKWENEQYQITIRNNAKENIEIEILDQLPISENSKITIKALQLGDGAYDDKTGSVLWTRKIDMGKTTQIDFSYEIKYPKDMQIQYSNR